MDGKVIISILLGFFSLLFFLIVIWGSSSNSQCLREEEARKEIINGRVNRVFVDHDNHSYPTLEINMAGENKEMLIFLFERSGCFEYLQPGDSIVKENGNLTLEVFRNNTHKIFNLYYGCIEK